MGKYQLFSKSVLAAATLAASMGFAGQASAQTELQLSYFVGDRHPMNAAVVQPFIEKLAEVSGGQLTVNVHFGGSLVQGGPPQYGALIQGVSDIAFGLPGYTGPVFPFSNMMTVPGMSDSAEDATNRMWNAMDVIQTEYNAKILALWGIDQKVLLTKRPVRSMADLQGMKIRVTSAQDIPYIEALGATAIATGVGVVHEMLTNDTIDGIHIGASSIRSFALHEPAEFVTTNLPVSISGIFLLMNQDVFDDLTPQEQGWINEASGRELSLLGGRAYDRAGLGSVAFAIDNGVEEIKLSDAEKASWQATMQPIVNAFLQQNLDTSQSSSSLQFRGENLFNLMGVSSN